MKNNFEQRVQVTLKALKNPPGKWGTPSWTWNGTASASAKFVCSNDKSHVKTVKATITSKTTKATCTTDGKTVYTATVTLNGKTYTDTKTVTITKTGHKFSAWKTTAFDTDKNTSTQTRTCSACNKTESRTIENAIQRLAGATRYGTAKAVLTNENREGLRKLLDFRFKRHPRYNLDSKRLKLIENQIRKRAKLLLEN